MVVDRSRRRCLLCEKGFTGSAFVCRECADHWRNRPIPDEVLRMFYQQVDLEYPEWANTYGNYNPPRALTAWMMEQGRDLRILEIGAGGGFLLENLWHAGFRSLTGSDITFTALEEITRRDARIRVTGADAESLPFRDGSFDVVISSDVIEHLLRPNVHLLEVHRVLAPGGRYLLKTPNRRLAQAYYRLRALYDHHIWHPSMMSSGELHRMLSWNGFDVEFLEVSQLTAAQIRKIPTRLARDLFRRLPIQRLPAALHPHLEIVATRLN